VKLEVTLSQDLIFLIDQGTVTFTFPWLTLRENKQMSILPTRNFGTERIKTWNKHVSLSTVTQLAGLGAWSGNQLTSGEAADLVSRAAAPACANLLTIMIKTSEDLTTNSSSLHHSGVTNMATMALPSRRGENSNTGTP